MTESDHHFLSIAQLLVMGGDERITSDPGSGLNKYGYPPTAEPGVPAYGSSTASAISQSGFQSAERLREKLQNNASHELPAISYARELDSMRVELQGFAAFPDTDIIFTDSGTTAHLLAAQIIAQSRNEPTSTIMMAPAETGRGVPSALGGKHFSENTPQGNKVIAGKAIGPGCDLPTVAVMVRDEDGNPRPLSSIDAEVDALTGNLLESSQSVLLNLVDCSKTGLIAPSPRCAMALKRKFPGRLDVLIDACQYRLSPTTVRAYLEQGFIVALTGSKFMCGPSFSGALLIPGSIARQMRTCSLSPSLAQYAGRAEWPEEWAVREILPDTVNYGLLLRWEAALVEMRAFHALSEKEIRQFFEVCAAAIRQKLMDHPAFEPLDVPMLERHLILGQDSWDTVQTIFPFLLRKPDGVLLTREETKRVYDLSGRGSGIESNGRCRLGQPVECGSRRGVPVSALRLCLSAHHAVDALTPEGRGTESIIAEALFVLDRIAAFA